MASDDDDLIEVKPLDPTAPSTSEDSMYIPDQPIPEEPPEFSIGEMIGMFRERSFSEILKDEAWGPHVHLLIILVTVFFIAIVIGVITWAVG